MELVYENIIFVAIFSSSASERKVVEVEVVTLAKFLFCSPFDTKIVTAGAKEL